MNTFSATKKSLFILFSLCIYGVIFAADIQSSAAISGQIFNKVKENNNWKFAFLTAKDAQIVFMSISPSTNPKNEIGMETHKFDQIIFVVEGKGKAILNGKVNMIKSGDLISIPQGVKHNVINVNSDKPLKILSVYSSRDIPADATYQKKSDEPHHEDNNKLE